jgi:PAS domain S-box-containing protein
VKGEICIFGILYIDMPANSTEQIKNLRWYSMGLPRVYQILIWISFVITLLICFLDLAGWLFNITPFKSILAEWESMKLITAICFISVSVALITIQLLSKPFFHKIVQRVLASFIFLISFVTIYVYLHFIITGYESSLTGKSYLAFFVTPVSRMALLTAINFLLISCIIFLLSINKKITSAIAHALTLPVMLVSYFAAVSYVLGVYSATELEGVSVSFNTDIAFCCICCVILLMRPETWLLRVFTSDNLGGLISRRLIPAIMIIPVIIGWLRIKGEHAGLFESEKGVVLVAVIYTVCFLILVWFLARSVGNINQKRLTTELALKESESRYRKLTENIPDMIARFDSNLSFLYGNQAFMNRMGVQIENPAFKSSTGYDPIADVADKWERAAREVLNTGESRRLEHTRTWQGKTMVYDVLIVPELGENSNVISIISISRDITDYKRAEDHLKYQSSMLGAVTDAIIGTDLSLVITYWNKAAEKIYGWKQEEVLGRSSKDVIRSEMTQDQREAIYKEILSGQPVYTELVQYTKDDQKLIIEGYTIPLMDSDGKITSIVAINSDITEMRLAENIIKNSEQKLKYHLENSPLAVIEWDKEFQILQWSSEAEKIFGLKKEEVLGTRIDLLNIIHEEDIPLVQKTMERLTSGKEIKVVSRNRNYTKDREVIHCVWHNSVLLDNNGTMASVMSLVENITTLRRIESALIESKEKYEELITNARSIIVKIDTEGRFTFINKYGQSFFGYSEEELLGKNVIDTIVPKTESSGRNLSELVDSIYEDPDKFSININENIKKNGNRVWIDWRNKALFDKNGNRTGHMAIGIDITERKKAEEDLKELEDKLWSVLNATQESIYMFDPEGKITMSNTTGLERLIATSGNEIVGHHFSEFMAPEIAEKRQAKLDKVFNYGKPLDFEDERDGKVYHHNFSPVFKNGKVSFVVSYSADITNRKRAEDKLKESEDRFRTIAESLPILISINRISDSIILFVNEPYEKAFGFINKELEGKKVYDIFFNPEDRKSLSATLKGKGGTYNTELKVKKSDGTPFWIMTSIRTIMFMNEPAYLTASIDITETKKVQEELLRLNRALNAHSKSSQMMMHSDNELAYLNDACRIVIEDCGYKMVWIGYAQNDRNKSVKPVAYYGFNEGYLEQLNVTWSDTTRGRGPTGTAIRTGKPSICLNMYTDPAFEPWRKEAIKRGYASSLVLPLISDKKTFGAITIYSGETNRFLEKEIILLSDLASDLAYGISYFRLSESEKKAVKAIKESEAQLKELNATKDKFFNIIAHDLKNPFTSLLGSSELLYNNIRQMSKENIIDLTLILNDSAKSGYAILLNLLDWSRSQTGLLKVNPERINIKDLINDNLQNLQLPAANKEIGLYSLAEGDLIINADRNMINTVLRNLLSNAVKFTRRGGRVLVNAKIENDDVIISVKDTGIGISEEVIKKLFRIDSKNSMPGTENEQGTGLGLKLSKEFVEKLGGKIWVESAENKGSEFIFSVPLNKV